MPKVTIDCPECGAKSTISSSTAEPIQCCPFCGNTTLPVGSDDEEDYDDDALSPFDPDAE